MSKEDAKKMASATNHLDAAILKNKRINPSESQEVSGFLDAFVHGRYGHCLKMLDNEKMVLLTGESFKKLTSKIDYLTANQARLEEDVTTYSELLNQVKGEHEMMLQGLRELTLLALPVLNYLIVVKDDKAALNQAFHRAMDRPLVLGITLKSAAGLIGGVHRGVRKALNENKGSIALGMMMIDFYQANQEKLKDHFSNIGQSLKTLNEQVLVKYIPEIQEFMDQQPELLKPADAPAELTEGQSPDSGEREVT